MKKFKELFQFKKPDDVLLVNGEKESNKKKVLFRGQYFYYGSILFFLLMIVFSYLSTFDLMHRKENMTMKYAELLEEKEKVEQDLASLRQMTAEVESIRGEQALVERAIPVYPRYDQVLSFIEEKINEIKREHYIELPENISWRRVSESDLKNANLEGLGVYQYSLSMEGSYQGILEFFRELRTSIRLMDVVSVSSFRSDLEGRVQIDLSFWAYHTGIAELIPGGFVRTDTEILELVKQRLLEKENLPDAVEMAPDINNFGREELFFSERNEELITNADENI